MYLVQGKDTDSYQLLVQALRVYEGHGVSENWSQLVQIYQDVARCDLSQSKPKSGVPVLSELKLAEHVMSKLSLVLKETDNPCEPALFVQVLKLIIEPHLLLLPK